MLRRTFRSRLIVFALIGLGAAVATVVSCILIPTSPPPDVPAPDPVSPISFTDVTEQARLGFRHFNGAAGQKLLPETMGSGVAVLDFDRDGRPDLFFVNGRPWPGQPNPPTGRVTQALYRNTGTGTFEDVTAARGLDVELYGLGVAVGDVDNDGFTDLLVTAVGGCRLFHNLRGQRFEDVTGKLGTIGAGLPTPTWPTGTYAEFLRREEPLPFPASAAFLDFDGNGYLDLFVCQYLTWSPAADVGVPATLPGGIRAYVPPQYLPAAHCKLYRNLGQGFEDVSEFTGIQYSDPGSNGRPGAKALGVVVCDPDADGWPDLVIANDTVRNFYFHNVPGPNGTRRFEEQGLYAGLAYADSRPRGGMGIDSAEIEPGALTIVVANFTNEPNTLFRRISTQPVRFADAAAELGVAGPSLHAMKFGALFFDCDNDGRMELFTCNGHLEPDIAAAQPGQTYRQPAQLFWNTGEARPMFRIAATSDFPPMVGRGCAYLDYDGDGDLDLVVTDNNGPARLFRNDTPPGGNVIRLVLLGQSLPTNRDAIGAEVTVEAGGVTRRFYVSPTRGYLSQSELPVSVGLGAAEQADRVSVRWPGAGRRTQEWRNLQAGKGYGLIQDRPDAVNLSRGP